MKRSWPRGFTLVELLVVMAIIAVLIGLLLPAINTVKEMARRSACSVNMKQIGYALKSYESAFNALPPAAFYGKNGAAVDDTTGGVLKGLKPGNGTAGTTAAPYSILVKMLPYLEKDSLYRSINFSANNEAFATGNTAVGAQYYTTVVNVFTCPSFTGSPKQISTETTDYTAANGAPALSQYKVLGATTLQLLQNNGGTTDYCLDPNYNGGGITPYGSPNMKAPTSTAVMCETREPKYAAWFDGSCMAIPGFHPGDSNNVYNDTYNNAGVQTGDPTLGQPALNHDLFPVTSGQNFEKASTDFGGSEDMQWGPSSEHPGLVNHLLGQTEVKALSNDIAAQVYRALISRRDDDNGNIGTAIQ